VSPVGWYVLVVTGPPLAYGLFLVLHEAVRKRQRRTRQADRHTVTTIAARIEREEATRAIRWPRADPDRGVVRDERPTTQLPKLLPAPTLRIRRYVQRPRPPH
jgi:hypothetical protein